MKKLLLLLAAVFVISSCSTGDNDNIKFYVEYVPVESVEMPDYFVPDHNYKIKMTYKRPTDCHYFHGFNYDAVANTIVFGIETFVVTNIECQPLDGQVEEVYFNFECNSRFNYTSYTFRFYKGEENGQPVYREIVVPVKK